MKISKYVPIWLLVVSAVSLVATIILRAAHTSIMKTYHPTSAIESMKMGDSLGWVTTTVTMVTVGLWAGMLYTVYRSTKR